MTGADCHEEVFEIFDDDGNVIGLKHRRQVHEDGDWHKGVDVFVLSRINGKTMMVIQKRSSLKKIAPSCWDLSCAEHLGIGETYLDGAIRGVKEELGLEGISLKGEEMGEGGRRERKMVVKGRRGVGTDEEGVLSVLREADKSCYDDEERGLHEHMIRPLYMVYISADNLEKIQPDGVEVSEIAWKSVKEIKQIMDCTPENVTPWFLRRREALNSLLDPREKFFGEVTSVECPLS